ncbi:hypothetical protein ACNKHW_00745 [Shigella flexneri]
MNHFFAGIQQDPPITQAQGRELWNIHCRSKLGVSIKAKTSSQACCNALSLWILQLRAQPVTACLRYPTCYDDA